MRFYRGLHNLPRLHGPCVATIGNFDGVHLGHQQVLDQLRQLAASQGVPAVVCVFEPTPLEYFAPESAPARLTRLGEKLPLLEQSGVDAVLCLPFNQKLAQLSPEAFIQQVLVDGLQAQQLVVGDDFRFGRQRAGDFQTLVQAGQQQGFAVTSTSTFVQARQRVSSTRIRQALASGELQAAQALLGRPYEIAGRIAPGRRLGRTIGFPTANVGLRRRVPSVHGVFVVQVHGLAEQPLPGVCNVGKRPTVSGHHCVLETHIFDFNQDVYGRRVRVQFLDKLREEEKFDSLDVLRQQIALDAEQARAYFSEQSQ